jgi:hypothetical protein
VKRTIRAKFWFFKNYWWIFTAATVLIICNYFFQSNMKFSTLLTAFGTFLSIIYFLQKQRLEETKLFRDIFSECNKRYESMNDSLNAIIEGNDETKLKPDERAILNDYFNLCGEEHLFYTQGYIFPKVWENWQNGMKIFLDNPRIKSVWEEEMESESYYGLSF